MLSAQTLLLSVLVCTLRGATKWRCFRNEQDHVAVFATRNEKYDIPSDLMVSEERQGRYRPLNRVESVTDIEKTHTHFREVVRKKCESHEYKVFAQQNSDWENFYILKVYRMNSDRPLDIFMLDYRIYATSFWIEVSGLYGKLLMKFRILSYKASLNMKYRPRNLPSLKPTNYLEKHCLYLSHEYEWFQYPLGDITDLHSDKITSTMEIKFTYEIYKNEKISSITETYTAWILPCGNQKRIPINFVVKDIRKKSRILVDFYDSKKLRILSMILVHECKSNLLKVVSSDTHILFSGSSLFKAKKYDVKKHGRAIPIAHERLIPVYCEHHDTFEVVLRLERFNERVGYIGYTGRCGDHQPGVCDFKRPGDFSETVKPKPNSSPRDIQLETKRLAYGKGLCYEPPKTVEQKS